MGAKVFFSLERIPARYGAGYKAKMKRRETRTAEECARLDTRLRGMPHKMMVTHCEAILDAMFRVAAETGCICRLGDYLAIDPHVRGHFDKPTDRFDPRKGHSVSFTIKPGRKLKRLAATFAAVNECNIEQNRCYHLVSRLAHRAFFLDDEEAVKTKITLSGAATPTARRPAPA